VDRIRLAQDRNWWLAVVKTVMDYQIHTVLEISWAAGKLLTSQKIFGSMELFNLPEAFHSEIREGKYSIKIILRKIVCFNAGWF
jgi:hypothetical protein